MSEERGLRFNADERRRYDEDGYVVRERVFDRAELGKLADACEAVVRDLESVATGRHLQMGSYVFEIAPSRRTVIKWEKGRRDTVLGVEPLAHLHPAVAAFAHDARLTERPRTRPAPIAARSFTATSPRVSATRASTSASSRNAGSGWNGLRPSPRPARRPTPESAS